MQPRTILLCLALPSVLGLACSDDTTAATTPPAASSSEGSSSSGDEDPDTSGDAPETGETESESESESETGEPGPSCGDGNLDPGEECDDANMADGDGCSSACVSACGAEFWLDINAPQGWFDVQDMQSDEDEGIVLAGALEFNDTTPGRLRVARYLGEELVAAVESEALGSAGTLELPQTHAADAVLLTAEGDVLALGTSTEVLVEGEDPVISYWLGRYAEDDLDLVWRVELPAPISEEFSALDLTALEGGDPVLTMTTQPAANDRDITVVRRDFADGAEVWSTNISGELNGGYSFDEAAKVAAGPGDRLWAAGIIRVDWQTNETTVFELDPSDGSIVWSEVPLPDPGNAHEQIVYDLAAGPEGRVAVGIGVRGPAAMYSYSTAFLYDEQVLAWSLFPEDLPWDDGEPYLAPRVSLDADGDVLITGSYTHSFNFATAARPWITAFAPDGTQLCAARIGQGSDAGLAPRNGFFGSGRGAVNVDTYGAGGMGPGSDGNWLVGLRGW